MKKILHNIIKVIKRLLGIHDNLRRRYIHNIMMHHSKDYVDLNIKYEIKLNLTGKD